MPPHHAHYHADYLPTISHHSHHAHHAHPLRRPLLQPAGSYLRPTLRRSRSRTRPGWDQPLSAKRLQPRLRIDRSKKGRLISWAALWPDLPDLPDRPEKGAKPNETVADQRGLR